MRLMRKRNPQLKEDGFHSLLPYAGEHVEELIAEFSTARDDHGLRCWLLELIGEARSPAALSILVAQLNGPDPDFREWARRGLELLGSKPAREALWHASANEQGHQYEN